MIPLIKTPENNPNRPQILDYLYKKLHIGGSGSGKNKCFIEVNLINYQHNIGEMYMLKIPMNQNISCLLKSMNRSV